MSKPWPRWGRALAGFVFLALFVTVPDIRKAGLRPALLIIGMIAGAVARLPVGAWLSFATS